MTRQILVGNSLGGESEDVVKAALAIGRGVHAPVHVVHAFEPPVPMGPPEEAWVFQRELEEKLRGELSASLHRQMRRLDLALVDGSTAELKTGSPYRVLEETARSEKPGLVVVGSAVDGVRMWRALGSTADRLLRRVPSPVLVIAPNGVFPPRRVLLATDFSDVSAGAMRAAGALLKAAGVAPEWVEVVFVLDGIEAHSLTQFTAEQMAQFAAERLERFVAEHGRDLGPNVHRKVLLGTAREALLAQIALERPDLVVLGTHGRGGLDRLLLGSVAAAVLRVCPCNTLVIPPEAAAVAMEARDASADWEFVADHA